VTELGAEDEYELLSYNPYAASDDERRWYVDCVHPHGTVPAMMLNDDHSRVCGLMLESGAICMYLAERHAHLLPQPDAVSDYLESVPMGRRQVKICGVKRHGERGARAYNGGLEAERSPLPPCKNSSDLYQFSKSGVIWICPPQSTLWRRHCLYRLSFALENTTGGKLAAAQSDGARGRVTRIQILFACPIKQHQLISIILPAQH